MYPVSGALNPGVMLQPQSHEGHRAGEKGPCGEKRHWGDGLRSNITHHAGVGPDTVCDRRDRTDLMHFNFSQ